MSNKTISQKNKPRKKNLFSAKRGPSQALSATYNGERVFSVLKDPQPFPVIQEFSKLQHTFSVTRRDNKLCDITLSNHFPTRLALMYSKICKLVLPTTYPFEMDAQKLEKCLISLTNILAATQLFQTMRIDEQNVVYALKKLTRRNFKIPVKMSIVLHQLGNFHTDQGEAYVENSATAIFVYLLQSISQFKEILHSVNDKVLISYINLIQRTDPNRATFLALESQNSFKKKAKNFFSDCGSFTCTITSKCKFSKLKKDYIKEDQIIQQESDQILINQQVAEIQKCFEEEELVLNDVPIPDFNLEAISKLNKPVPIFKTWVKNSTGLDYKDMNPKQQEKFLWGLLYLDPTATFTAYKAELTKHSIIIVDKTITAQMLVEKIFYIIEKKLKTTLSLLSLYFKTCQFTPTKNGQPSQFTIRDRLNKGYYQHFVNTLDQQMMGYSFGMTYDCSHQTKLVGPISQKITTIRSVIDSRCFKES